MIFGSIAITTNLTITKNLLEHQLKFVFHQC
jgi:hypothetical protein